MDTKDMEKEQTRVAEATTPALDGNDAPMMKLVFDPETGEFYEVPAGIADPTCEETPRDAYHYEVLI